jgi:hypothetical protein
MVEALSEMAELALVRLHLIMRPAWPQGRPHEQGWFFGHEHLGLDFV